MKQEHVMLVRIYSRQKSNTLIVEIYKRRHFLTPFPLNNWQQSTTELRARQGSQRGGGRREGGDGGGSSPPTTKVTLSMAVVARGSENAPIRKFDMYSSALKSFELYFAHSSSQSTHIFGNIKNNSVSF
jgi:hypothetical protein